MSLVNSLNRLWDSKRNLDEGDREKAVGGKAAPALEPLESLCLLSTLQTIIEPTVSVPPTLTNFGNDPNAYEGPQPFTPSIPLFNPALGTLVAVHINGSAQMTNQTGVENLSHSSATNITTTATGGFTVNGVGQAPITGTMTGPAQTFDASTFDGTIDYVGTSGHTFAPINVPRPISETLTSPADLAFFTASAGHATTAPTLSGTAHSDTEAPGGNLSTLIMTKVSGQLTISYDYMPTCPSVVTVVRYGVHREHTQLVVTFSGPVDAATASNASNYRLVRRGANGQFTPTPNHILPIKEVVYNPQTFTATIVPVRSIPIHHRVQLTVKSVVFCPDDSDYTTVLGGKSSIGGFIYHNSGRFFAVQHGRLQLPATTPPPGFLTNL